jgi:O-antigen/teichoic acid export membrane protein
MGATIGCLIEPGWRLFAHLKRNASPLKSASIYLATAALTAGAPLVLLPLLTRIFTPEEYGKVAMFSAAAQIFGVTTGLSTHGAVGMRYFDREKLDFPRYVSSCLIVLLMSTALTLLLAWTTLHWLENITKLPGAWLIAAVVYSASGFVIQVQLSIWQSSKNATRFGALRAFQGIVDLSASIFLVLALGLTWQGRVGGIIVAGFAASAYSLLSLARGGWLRLPLDTAYARNALSFGLPLVPHAAGGILVMMSDRLLITNMLDISFTGIYLVASQLGMVLYLANDALNRAYSPLLIEALKLDDSERDKKIVRLTYVYFACLLLVAIAFGAIAPAILGVIVGPKFQAADSVFMFIAIGQAFSGMYLMVATYIFYAGRTAYLALLTMSAGLANLTITFWLLRLRGLVGAGEAFMVTQLLFFLGAWALAHRCRPMPWFRAFSFDPMIYAKGGIIGIVMFAYASVFIPFGEWEVFSKSASQQRDETSELIDASGAGNLELITSILAGGADVNAANELGVTPLIAASSALKQSAVVLLLSHGANRSLKTKEGFSAYDFAKNQLNEKLASMLAEKARK